MNALVSGPFADALEAQRPRFNALFAQARHAAPALDPAAFADHLRLVVAPIVDAVHAAAPDRVRETVDVLYEFALDLIARDLPARCPAVADGWRELLPALPRHLAAAPRGFAGSITNALYNLSQVPGARPREWLDAMHRLGQRHADSAALLECGKVLAWRAGLAHYRGGALDTALNLAPELARDALGLPDAADVPEAVRRLRADPWRWPDAILHGARRLRIARAAGAFRGFGGVFLRPPRVAFADGHFLVSDGEGCWSLHADVFGATLQRAGAELPDDRSADTFRIDRAGRVTSGGDSYTFAELRGRTSAACDGTTLAVTVPLSHAVFLIARS